MWRNKTLEPFDYARVLRAALSCQEIHAIEIPCPNGIRIQGWGIGKKIHHGILRFLGSRVGSPGGVPALKHTADRVPCPEKRRAKERFGGCRVSSPKAGADRTHVVRG